MTTLVAFVGVDDRRPSSAYLVADSRLSWGGGQTWDAATKLFVSRRHPELFGFCGDALLPSQVLARLVEAVDSGVVVEDGASPEARSERIAQTLSGIVASYPAQHLAGGTNVIHVLRHGRGMAATFHFAILRLKVGGSGRPSYWESEPLTTRSDVSHVVYVGGSGRDAFERALRRWNEALSGETRKRTSRAIFSAFCDAVGSGDDPKTGGPPQAAVVYRGSPGGVAARHIGIISDGVRYFIGAPLDREPPVNIEWRDELFQVCDGKTGKRRTDAQPQPRPRGLETKPS